ADARFRTLALNDGTYVEALGAVPGHGLEDAPGVDTPAIYGITLRAAGRDVGALGTLLPLVALVGVVLLLVILIGRALASGIDRPVNQLVGAAKQVAQGDLRTHVSTTREDELGALAAAFNAMSDQLRATVGRLQQTAIAISQSTSEISD